MIGSVLTAYALSKILAFSEPKIDFEKHLQTCTVKEQMAALPYAVDDPRGFILGYLPGLIPMPVLAEGIIKTVQKVAITIAGSSASNTGTLATSVDTNRTVLAWGNYISQNTGATNYTDDIARATLTNATTVTANRQDNSSANAVTVYVTALEFWTTTMKSVQYGTISVTGAATSNTASISSVTTGNSAVMFLGQNSSFTGSSRAGVFCQLTLTSATVVTADKNSGGGSFDTTISFCVFEFESGILNSSTQEVHLTISSGGTVNATLGVTVTANQVWCSYGGQMGAYSGSANGQYLAYVYLASGTTLTAFENLNNALTIAVTVIEFKAADIEVNSQRGHADEVADNTTQKDTTITSVDTTKSWYQYLGQTQTTGSGANASRVEAAGELQAATNVRQYLGADTGTLGVTPSWEVISVRNS